MSSSRSLPSWSKPHKIRKMRVRSRKENLSEIPTNIGNTGHLGYSCVFIAQGRRHFEGLQREGLQELKLVPAELTGFMAEEFTFVTGATGFIGSHVVRQLLHRGDRVRILARNSSRKSNIEAFGCEIAIGDLKDSSSLLRCVQGCRFVYHVAADYRLWARNPQDIYDNNVGGTRNLLSACCEAGSGEGRLHQHRGNDRHEKRRDPGRRRYARSSWTI